jgi:hypothetical protein
MPSQAHIAAFWHAVKSVAEKETKKRRPDLPAGRSFPIELELSGRVSDEPSADYNLSAQLTVGHDGTRNASQEPPAAQVIACVLGRMRADRRRQVLADLIADCAANSGKLPAQDPALVTTVEGVLAQLRSTVAQPVKGSVSCQLLALRDNLAPAAKAA